jgi:hypothetical protein
MKNNTVKISVENRKRSIKVHLSVFHMNHADGVSGAHLYAALGKMSVSNLLLMHEALHSPLNVDHDD